MDKNNSKNHWENIYITKSPQDVSWYQAIPEISLKLIQEVTNNRARILDIGAGASTLVDNLLELGYSKLAVLDISCTVIYLVKKRLGDQAYKIEFYNSDIRDFKPALTFDIWHDRAVFHFLLDQESKKQYINALKNSLKTSGHAIIATFAEDGPKKCSGLDIKQYNQESIRLELGDEFKLLRSVLETHLTPWGAEQRFIYFIFERN